MKCQVGDIQLNNVCIECDLRLHQLLMITVFCPDSDWRLILIKQHEYVGEGLNKSAVFRIGKVAFLPLSSKKLPADFELSVSA